jgi:hypothetical protein
MPAPPTRQGNGLPPATTPDGSDLKTRNNTPSAPAATGVACCGGRGAWVSRRSAARENYARCSLAVAAGRLPGGRFVASPAFNQPAKPRNALERAAERRRQAIRLLELWSWSSAPATCHVPRCATATASRRARWVVPSRGCHVAMGTGAANRAN